MDIQSKDRLKQALQAFDGTLIVVSHDRDFLDGLVGKLYEFRDGRVKEHLGGVQDFLQRLRLRNLQELEAPAKKQQAADAPKKEKTPQPKGFTKEDRKLRARLVTVENAIAEKEEKLKIIEESLANPGNNADIFALTAEYQELRQVTDSLTEEWTALMEQLDN